MSDSAAGLRLKMFWYPIDSGRLQTFFHATQAKKGIRSFGSSGWLMMPMTLVQTPSGQYRDGWSA